VPKNVSLATIEARIMQGLGIWNIDRLRAVEDPLAVALGGTYDIARQNRIEEMKKSLGLDWSRFIDVSSPAVEPVLFYPKEFLVEQQVDAVDSADVIRLQTMRQPSSLRGRLIENDARRRKMMVSRTRSSQRFVDAAMRLMELAQDGDTARWIKFTA
jgi:hypothetical protein